MAADNSSQLTIETRVKGDDVRVVVNRGERKLGSLVLSNETICWAPWESNDSDESRKMTWVMTWEQFSEVMQSGDLSEVVRMSQSTYASAARADQRIAVKEDHLNLSLPRSRESLGLLRHFNHAEFILIRKGSIPASMDDKWFIYFDPERFELRIHRSWTGFCIYTLRFREDSEGFEVSEAWVNRKAEQYSSTDNRYDAELASWLIDVFLLGKERDFPSDL